MSLPPTLTAQLWHWAETTPDAVALRHKGKGLWHEFTWRDFLLQVATTARALHHTGIKRGDFVFDARALPNPYWQAELRGMTGLDAPVIQFLDNDTRTARFFGRLNEFVMGTLTDFSQSDRSYLTIAIGCTGGQHRSVYLTQKLHASLTKHFTGIQIRHRDLPANEIK